jgi:hypothetical protein
LGGGELSWVGEGLGKFAKMVDATALEMWLCSMRKLIFWRVWATMWASKASAVMVETEQPLSQMTLIITAVPAFATLEERQTITGSTPASFDAIPPVLHYKENDVSVTLDPPLQGLQETRGTLYLLERCATTLSPFFTVIL